MLIAQTKFDAKSSVTRRRALEFLGGAFTPGITLGNLPQQSEALTGSLQYGLIDALEEHGQWATGRSWADDIHRSMRASVTAVARGTASGNDGAATATGLALQRLVSSARPPDGAVVVVYGRPGALRLRDAHSAYQMVRSSLRPDAYCAYSPLFEDGPDDRITAEVTLGWHILGLFGQQLRQGQVGTTV
jgi:hypothetical protein